METLVYFYTESIIVTESQSNERPSKNDFHRCTGIDYKNL